MNRIDNKFKELKIRKQRAFIAYICAGDPDISTTEKIVLALEDSGVDIIELGVPFSDPLADGPTIQRASQRALKNNINIDKIFALIRSLRKKTDIPIILMGYYNPIYHYGVNRFIKDAKEAGVDGAIIPDLAIEESDDIVNISKTHEFNIIFLVAPTSTRTRLKKIAKASGGFIYYVSLTGVTGVRRDLSKDIKKHIGHIKSISRKPVCVGFGVSSKEQVKNLSRFSDGVIVGSAIINIIENNIKQRNRIPKKVSLFVKQLTRGLR